MRPLVEESVTFLRSIGIEVETARSPLAGSFVPGVWMNEGRLVLHPETAHVSDVLHEAGHLATVPSELRGLTRPGIFPGELLEAACARCLKERPFTDEWGREDVVLRGILQMGDCEASAWSYAAAVAMGVPPEILIEARGDGTLPYSDMEAATGVLDGLRRGQYFGINGLAAAKFCNLRSFPKMLRWLAP